VAAVTASMNRSNRRSCTSSTRVGEASGGSMRYADSVGQSIRLTCIERVLVRGIESWY
jgi:hypothetical protein